MPKEEGRHIGRPDNADVRTYRDYTKRIGNSLWTRSPEIKPLFMGIQGLVNIHYERLSVRYINEGTTRSFTFLFPEEDGTVLQRDIKLKKEKTDITDTTLDVQGNPVREEQLLFTYKATRDDILKKFEDTVTRLEDSGRVIQTEVSPLA